MFAKNFQKHDLISPEDIDPNLTYTFTISPKEQYGNGSLDTRLKQHLKNILSIINKLGTHKDYYFKLYPELSRTGRLHYHGEIKISNIFIFYLNIQKILDDCTLEIDVIKEPQVWKDYCRKQEHLWKDIVYPYPLKWSDSNIIKKTSDATYVKDITKFLI